MIFHSTRPTMTLLARAVQLRDRIYRTFTRGRIAANWKNAAYMAEIDRIQENINRADRIKRNRSDGAKRGWVKRRANAAKRNGNGDGAAIRKDAGPQSSSVNADASSEVATPAPLPDTWDDHNDAPITGCRGCGRSSFGPRCALCIAAEDFEDEAIRSTGGPWATE